MKKGYSKRMEKCASPGGVSSEILGWRGWRIYCKTRAGEARGKKTFFCKNVKGSW